MRGANHATRGLPLPLPLCPMVSLPPLPKLSCSSFLSSNWSDCLCVLHSNCAHVFAILCDAETC